MTSQPCCAGRMSCDSGPVKAIREASPQALHHFSLDFSSAQVGLVGLGVPGWSTYRA